VGTASKKSQILKKKSQKAEQFFLTPTTSKKSQICEIWRQKSQSGNPVSFRILFTGGIVTNSRQL